MEKNLLFLESYCIFTDQNQRGGSGDFFFFSLFSFAFLLESNVNIINFWYHNFYHYTWRDYDNHVIMDYCSAQNVDPMTNYPANAMNASNMLPQQYQRRPHELPLR
jgi:hypothetical protein